MIRPRTAKRARAERLYRTMVKHIFFSEGPIRCEVLPGAWTATQVHHRRGRLGTLLIDRRFFHYVSAQGQDWIHTHPEEATKRGFFERGQWNNAPKDAETERLKLLLEPKRKRAQTKAPIAT